MTRMIVRLQNLAIVMILLWGSSAVTAIQAAESCGKYVKKDEKGRVPVLRVQRGVRFNCTVPAEADGPLVWALKGDLPPGIEFDRKTGTFDGTPTKQPKKTYDLDLELVDASGLPATLRIQLEVLGPRILLGSGEGPKILLGSSKDGGTSPAVSSAKGKPGGNSANQGGTKATLDSAKPPSQPEIVGVLKEGQRKVRVGAKKDAKIKIYIDNVLQKGKVLADQADPESYEVQLDVPLAAAQRVSAVQVINGVSSMRKEFKEVQASGFSWGRVRGYFTAGGIFSKERGNFSQNDFFLGLNVDKNWRWIDARDEEERKKDIRLFPWIGFNTYFDGRLTSIPVSEPDSEATDTTTGDAGGSNGNGSTGDNGTPGTGDSLNTFLASEKAALFQLGAYAPIRTTIWEHDGRPNTVFVAPIAKAGIQTITGEAQTVEAETFGQDDVFNFFALGIRIGHYKHSRTRNVGPQLISYLDITRGKWENFDLQENMNADSENTMAVRRRQWRWGFEGRLKIPGAPFQVGFDGNFGKGRDDLRILFGTNFDIGEVFNRLQSSQSDE